MNDLPNSSPPPSPRPQLRLHWRSLVLCFVISFGIAGIGNALTELGPWYYQLKQPPWKPPDAAFGAIWTTIFSLCSVSAWLAWNAAPTSGRRGKVLFLFLFNAALNICWSVLYFQLHRPDWSLWELFPLWLSVLWLVLGLWRESRLASLLVLPYLIWVSIAGVLNYNTVILNGPFVQALQRFIPAST